MKAGSARRAAASAGILAVVLAVLSACGGSDHRASALKGVQAHRLADAPSRNGGRVGGYGSHAVAVRHLRVPANRLYGEWYRPTDGTQRMPAVVTFGGSDGGLGPMPRFARAFATNGYPALALAYFKEPGLPKELDKIPLEYFARAIKWVQRQPGVDPGKVVLLGISRGGEGSLLIGATYPRLVHGVIALVPSHEVGPGWTLHGHRLKPFEFIPVERIDGPILTASGEQDQVWASSIHTEQIEQRLDDHHFRYPHARLNFPKAGHGLAGTAPVIWPRILKLMRGLQRS